MPVCNVMSCRKQPVQFVSQLVCTILRRLYHFIYCSDKKAFTDLYTTRINLDNNQKSTICPWTGGSTVHPPLWPTTTDTLLFLWMSSTRAMMLTMLCILQPTNYLPLYRAQLTILSPLNKCVHVYTLFSMGIVEHCYCYCFKDKNSVSSMVFILMSIKHFIKTRQQAYII